MTRVSKLAWSIEWERARCRWSTSSMEHQSGFPAALARSVRVRGLCMDAVGKRCRIRSMRGRDCAREPRKAAKEGSQGSSQGVGGSLPDSEPTQGAGKGGLQPGPV